MFILVRSENMRRRARIFMKYELEHFAEFLDNPASLGEDDFRAKVEEWMEYVRLRKIEDEFYFHSDEWQDKIEPLIKEIKRRNRRTPKLRREFERLNDLVDNLDRKDVAACRRAHRMMLDFMKKHRFAFKFRPEYIQQYEKSFNDWQKKVAAATEAEIRLAISTAEHRKSVEELDEMLAAEYERTGRLRVLTALRVKKRPPGN